MPSSPSCGPSCATATKTEPRAAIPEFASDPLPGTPVGEGVEVNIGKRAAKAKEIVGAVTADRRVEAEGRAEQAEAEPDEQAVAVEEHQVRVEHGDVHEDEP
jgi:uncharacterized protein YjbJ (UPF0337 family)